MKNVSTGLFLLVCSTKSPKLMGMLRDIAEFECAMAELSAVTGLSVKACADVVRNTCKSTAHSWEDVVAKLKHEALKGSKISGR